MRKLVENSSYINTFVYTFQIKVEKLERQDYNLCVYICPRVFSY